jgi:hypothetical protein
MFRLRDHRKTFSALRHRNFRLFFCGQLISPAFRSRRDANQFNDSVARDGEMEGDTRQGMLLQLAQRLGRRIAPRETQ